MSNDKLKCHLKSYKMKLTTLSPIFIGGGSEANLNKTQYIFNLIEKKAYIIDEKKWADFLLKHNLIDDFLRELTSRGEGADIFKWIEDIKKTKNINIEYKNYVKYIVQADKLQNDLNCFIKNSEGLPYVPGSSIKGALRTAVLFKIISDNKENYKNEWTRIKEALLLNKEKEIKEELQRIVKNIEKKALYTVEYNKSSEIELSAVNDIFKAIIVGDTMAETSNKLVILPKYDLSTSPNKFLKRTENQNKYDHTLPIYREYLTESKLNFNLSLDKSLVKENKYLNSFESINKSLKYFSDYFLAEDKGLYKLFLASRINISSFPNANLCLGGGTGFITKSIVHAIAPNKKEADDFIKNYLDISFKNPFHRHANEDNIISPRTLKLAEYNRKKLIVGWCQLSMEKELC